VGQCSDVAGQPNRLDFSLPGRRQLSDKSVVGMLLANAVDLGLHPLAPRGGAFGKTRQRVGQAFALALDVEYIAMAWCLAPGGPLSRAQALPGIGDGIRRTEPLSGGIQQMHAPGVGVAIFLPRLYEAMAQAQLAPETVVVEVTEDTFITEPERARSVLTDTPCTRRITSVASTSGRMAPACCVAD